MSWILKKKLAQKRSRAGRWCGVCVCIERVGLLLLQLFPSGGATDIVSVTLFCIAVGTAIAWCGGRCAMPDGHCLNNILLFWRRSTAASVFRVGACFEVSLFCPPFPIRPSRLRGRLSSKKLTTRSPVEKLLKSWNSYSHWYLFLTSASKLSQRGSGFSRRHWQIL